MSQGFNGHSIPQNAHQVPATIYLTPFDQNAIQMAPSRLALGAHGSNNEGSTSSKNLYGRLVGKRKTLAHRKITCTCLIKFIPSKFSAQPSPLDDGSLLDDVRNDTKERMISSLFKNFPYPTTDETDEAANKALDDNIVEELEEWKLRHKGQSTLAQLKGTVKKFHKDSQGSACRLVVGMYSLFLPVLFRNTEEIIPLYKWVALELLSNNDYLDVFILWLMDDGQVYSIHIPFANHSVTSIAEYILVDQGYQHYISLDGPDWEVGLQNTFILSGAICEWMIQTCAGSSWFENSNVHCEESEVSCKRMKDQVSSLVGSEKVEFRAHLLAIRDVLSLLLVA
ncbi:hypothetical protein EDD22DRAFT_957217 [Suillus occidentalis]|nr:hypothetical protein EDD22DRAFT_957217 [Suillus occidentalis]